MNNIMLLLYGEQNRRAACKAIEEAPDGYIFKLSPPTRSNEQSARFHAMVREVSKQVEWAGRYWPEETWKTMFVASLFKQEVVQSLNDTSLIVINAKTSRLTVSEMSLLIDFVTAFGVTHGVEFSE